MCTYFFSRGRQRHPTQHRLLSTRAETRATRVLEGCRFRVFLFSRRCLFQGRVINHGHAAEALHRAVRRVGVRRGLLGAARVHRCVARGARTSRYSTPPTSTVCPITPSNLISSIPSPAFVSTPVPTPVPSSVRLRPRPRPRPRRFRPCPQRVHPRPQLHPRRFHPRRFVSIPGSLPEQRLTNQCTPSPPTSSSCSSSFPQARTS